MSKINLTSPKIVHVTSYYPPHLGGMENAAALIAEGFIKKGYTVSVYTSDIGYSREEVNDWKVVVHYLKSIELAHTPILFNLFFRLLALPVHSLIHLHVAQAYTTEIVYLIYKLRGIPYIAHIHGDVAPSGSLGFLLEPYKKWFLKRVLNSAAKIICLTESQMMLIASKYAIPLKSITVIPNGVAETYFLGEKTGENIVPHLLFVGRLSIQKNLPLLIEAISQMQTSVCLDVVGDGEEREKIEALIQKYQLKNVKLHGKKTAKELIDFYKSADIFVLPSLYEGFSLAMLEALAAGLPIVASDLPEIREILYDCGILVQGPTAEKYAKTLDAVLSNKDALCKLSAASIKKARSYSWENVLDSIEDVYKEINHETR